MNVTKEMTGDLTAVLKVEVAAADYAAAVGSELKQYRKKANHERETKAPCRHRKTANLPTKSVPVHRLR